MQPFENNEIHWYIAIDTSGSMIGSKIQGINDIMPQLISHVQHKVDNYPVETKLKVSILTFGSEINWLTPFPIAAKDIVHSIPRIYASNTNDHYYGEMFDALNEAFSSTYMQLTTSGGHYFAIVILLISDDCPHDSAWEKHLKKFKENPWFDVSGRIVITVGCNCYRDTYKQFAGDCIIPVHDCETLMHFFEYPQVFAIR